jgi:hypothetical protein
MALEIEKAKANRRATKQNILPLMPHDPVAFEQMLQFLYKDRFNLTADPPKPAPAITAIGRMHEIHELFSLAKHYQLPNLQKQVVKLFSQARMLSKVTPATFFDWAEDMYYEELDHDVGPFKAYFSRVAPVMLRGAKEDTLTELYRMTTQGGGFGCELFKAALLVCTPASMRESGRISTYLSRLWDRLWSRLVPVVISRKRSRLMMAIPLRIRASSVSLAAEYLLDLWYSFTRTEMPHSQARSPLKHISPPRRRDKNGFHPSHYTIQPWINPP